MYERSLLRPHAASVDHAPVEYITLAVVRKCGFKKEGFKRATLMEVPGLGHAPPAAEPFDKALEFVEKR